MKVMSALLLALAFCFSTVQAAEPVVFTKEGKEISIPDLAKELVKFDVVFVGELHGNQVSHALEIQLLEAMHKINPKMIVSFEQWERDTQEYVDAYLAGKIEELEFKQFSRPWPNYTDYRPMMEYAKANKLPVVASNIPRKYASLLRTDGQAGIDKLPAGEKEFIAKERAKFSDDYKNKFVATMVGAAKGGMPVTPAQHDAFFAAQCIKDDTMAESIQAYIKKLPGNVVIHYNGDFHSRGHLGTVEALAFREPKLKICVIAPNMGDGDMKAGDYLYGAR